MSSCLSGKYIARVDIRTTPNANETPTREPMYFRALGPTISTPYDESTDIKKTLTPSHRVRAIP